MAKEALINKIVEAIGKAENINEATCCMTRLRFWLKDKKAVDKAKLEALTEVLGVLWSGDELQVVVGTKADDLYRSIIKEYHFDQENKEDKDKWSAWLLELISSTLTPLIPPIMGAGFISIVLALLSQFGWLDSASSTYLILNAIANSVYYFFPVLIAISLSSRLKVNQMLAVVSACLLLYPDFINLFTTV